MRSTVSVTLPALSLTRAVAALNLTWPATSASVMFTVADPGATTVAPLLGSLSASVNFCSPVTMESRRIGTLTVFVVSPAAKTSGVAGAV